jgi:hypothetical protein
VKLQVIAAKILWLLPRRGTTTNDFPNDPAAPHQLDKLILFVLGGFLWDADNDISFIHDAPTCSGLAGEAMG